MKILFTSEAVVEYCNGLYHKTSFQPFINRYKYFGEIIFCSYVKLVDKSKQSVLNTEGLTFLFLEKEIQPLKLYSIKQHNKLKLEKAIQGIDIIVSHLPSPIGIEAVKLAKKYNKPYFVGVVGCAWDAYWNHGIKGKLVAIPYYISMRKIVKESPFAFYVTQKFLQKRYPCNGTTIGCSNVEITEQNPIVLDKRILKILNSNPDRINITTVAAVNVRYKGQEYVIRAIAKLNKSNGRKYHYFLVGGGDNSFLMNLVKSLKIVDYVHFVGPLPHEQISDFLDTMDIYIQPSRQEGLPRAVIEAMSRALPVFGSKTAGIPELLLDECVFDNCSVKQIMYLMSKIDNNQMIYYAKRNFSEAMKYQKSILDARRYNFYNSILKHYNLSKDDNNRQ